STAASPEGEAVGESSGRDNPQWFAPQVDSTVLGASYRSRSRDERGPARPGPGIPEFRHGSLSMAQAQRPALDLADRGLVSGRVAGEARVDASRFESSAYRSTHRRSRGP